MTTKNRPITWDARAAVRRGDTTARDRAANGAERPVSNVQVSHDAPPATSNVIPRSIVPHKNKGRDLKKQYAITLQIGFFLSLGLLIGVFRAPVQTASDFEIMLMDQESVQMEEILRTKQELKAPPPPRPPVPIEVPNEDIIDDVELNLDASLDVFEEIANLPPPPAAIVEAAVEDDEHEIFVIVEEMPELIGGTEALYKLLTYPEIARKAGLEGLVVVQITVERDGMPTDPVVVRTPGPILDQAAMDAVMKLRFKPGKQRGKPVRVRYAIPVRFRLRD